MYNFDYIKPSSVEDAVSQNTNSSEAKYLAGGMTCLLYTSPSPRDGTKSRMPSSA